MSREKIPTRIRTILAQKMRFLRFTRGWSQEVLAELAGLHRTYISQIERGQVSAAPVLSSLSRPAPLESPGLAFRGSPVQRGERSLDVRLFPPHPCTRGISPSIDVTSASITLKSWPMRLISVSPNCSLPRVWRT